jgi:hypothetical protein
MPPRKAVMRPADNFEGRASSAGAPRHLSCFRRRSIFRPLATASRASTRVVVSTYSAPTPRRSSFS